MTGQIDCQHVETVVRKVAGLQNPDAVVVQHTVDEDDGRLRHIEGFTAGVAVGGVAEYGEVHKLAC